VADPAGFYVIARAFQFWMCNRESVRAIRPGRQVVGEAPHDSLNRGPASHVCFRNSLCSTVSPEGFTRNPPR